MSKLLTTDLSTQTLRFQPGGQPQGFEVAVSNLSSSFATFQLELLASGVDINATDHWYRLAPDLSAKIPAGDRTQFSISILDVPPVPGGFVGKMTLTVRVFSLELREEDRRVVTLIIEGSGVFPPQLELAAPQLSGLPGHSVEIPVRLLNPNRTMGNVLLRLKGLPSDWLVEGSERRLQIPPQSESRMLFVCQIPASTEAISQTYAFQVEALQSLSSSVQVGGTLYVQPWGVMELDVEPIQSIIPAAAVASDDITIDAELDERANRDRTQQGIYTVQLNNQSNWAQPASLRIIPPPIPAWRRWLKRDRTASDFRDRITVMPARIDLKPGSVSTAQVYIQAKRPLLGWPHQYQFRVTPDLDPDGRFAPAASSLASNDPRLAPSAPMASLPPNPLEANPAEENSVNLLSNIERRPVSETLTLTARPHVAFWLQLLALVALVGLFFIPPLLRNQHRGPVNSVRFDGQANELVSASDDQTVRRWLRTGRMKRRLGNPLKFDKAVRVASYRPINNDAIALGFENGEVEIWDLLRDQQEFELQFRPGGEPQADDRVFALQFSPDARYLFSGHGSGAVVQWDLGVGNRLNRANPNQADPVVLPSVAEKSLNFAVQAIALVGSEQETLAIAGRFNRLVLWQTTEPSSNPISLSYPAGDANDYIVSLSSATRRPSHLATADTQGRITLWDLNDCLENQGRCTNLDSWSDGHDGQAVRSVALSDDACYLASGGEDGTVMLWSLDADGRVLKGKRLGRSRKPINSVDIIRLPNRVLVTSGGDNHRVNLYSSADKSSSCP
ncbi:MAG: hypothetical protein ACTS2F_05805 [Thainema sp.]